MRATIDGTVVADAPESDLISIEGNYYFPPASLSAGALSDSPTPYTCPWKGVAQYHDISAAGSEIIFDRVQVNSDLALIERTRQ